MDATLERKVEQLAREVADDSKTIADVNGVLRLLMKSTMERMLEDSKTFTTDLSGFIGTSPFDVTIFNRLDVMLTVQDFSGDHAITEAVLAGDYS